MAIDVSVITTEQQFDSLLEEIAAAEHPIAIDYETTGLSVYTDAICGVALSLHVGSGIYIPTRHVDGTQLDHAYVMSRLKPYLETKRWVVYNGSFEYRHTLHDDAIPGTKLNIDCDVYVVAKLFHRSFKSYKLDDIIEEFFNEKKLKLVPDLFAKEKDINFPILDVMSQAAPYAAADAEVTMRLYEAMFPSVGNDFIYKVEHELLPIIITMEENGMAINEDVFADAQRKLDDGLETLNTMIHAEVDAVVGEKVDFKITSPKQLGIVLFEKMGLPSPGKSPKSGQYLTNKVALTPYEGKYRVIDLLSTHREITRRKSSYAKKIPASVDPFDGKVHPRIDQVGARSGRFAVSQPPIQQVPQKDHWELEDLNISLSFRKGFIPDDGWYFIEGDYEQQELRIIAGESQEPALIEAFREGVDVHVRTASMLFSCTEDVVEKFQRDVAKAIGYGLSYGLTEQGLATRMAISVAEAARLIDTYFNTMSAVRRYQEKIVDVGRKNHMVLTKFGRKQLIPEYVLGDWQGGDRRSMNLGIQGTGADILKIATVRAKRALDALGWWQTHVRLIMEMHDSFLFMVRQSLPPEQVVPVLNKACAFDEGAIPSYPAFPVEWKVGSDWGSCQLVDVSGASAEVPVSYEEVMVEEVRDPDVSDSFTIRPLKPMSERDLDRFIRVLRDNPGINIASLRVNDRVIEATKYPTSLNVEACVEALQQEFACEPYVEPTPVAVVESSVTSGVTL